MTGLSIDIPVIETDRLTLRAYRNADLDAVAAFNQSPRSRWIGGPKTRHESWRVMCGILGHWVLRGYGIWMLEHRETGICAGAAGILHHDGWHEPELAWHLYDGFEGKGLAFEAATAARAYAARHFGIPAPVSYIDPANARSIALAKRLGATFEREGELLGEPCHIYRHPKQAEV